MTLAHRASFAIAGLSLCSLVGCRGCHSSREVTVYTSVDQVFSEPVFRDFEQRTGVRVRAVFDTEETKSTGVLNRLIAESSRPQADVFWSGDSVRPFQLIQRGLVEPYSSPEAQSLPSSSRATDGSWTGFAARARVLLVNKTKLPPEEMPRSIKDLAAPRWRGQVAMANPLYGTTTMHVAALFSVWGEARTRAFLNDIKANGAKIVSSNGEVKRLVVSGDVAFGLADTDDANEAIRQSSDVEVVYPDQDDLGVLVIPTAVVVLRGSPHPDEARRLVDYLVSAEVEKKLAESAAHMPLRDGVVVPPSIRSASSLRTMQVDYGRVASEMETQQPWLRQWMGL
ncbi:MAG: extracellular solute-binding protein [Polyangiaceae bacterium]|jgi:iron(III) transport system substrate-binding protein|nr:extracellular solute-binding protein [Polyangiaceae bacterium]